MHILVTVKDNKNRFITIKELETSLSIMRSNSKGFEWSDNEGYELDSRQCLHVHTLFKSANNLSVSKWSQRFSELTGLHVHLQPYKKEDDKKIRMYIKKEKVSKEILEDESRQYFLTKQKLFI